MVNLIQSALGKKILRIEYAHQGETFAQLKIGTILMNFSHKIALKHGIEGPKCGFYPNIFVKSVVMQRSQGRYAMAEPLR